MDIVFGLIGGLGLFLYGMRHMSDGLQKAAGTRLRSLLESLTTNRLMGVIMGTVVTALVQSSSTTTVMVVGFVNARLMTLSQAVGVIMGANIGTTVTAHLIAFRLEKYALPALGVGVAMVLFARGNKTRHFGQVVLGFGMLFLGLDLMSTTLKPLQEVQAFRDLLVSFSENMVLGVAAGTGLTVLLQSSSASIGILQSLATEGLITIQSALPILFGDNIGTTITAVLSAIGASTTAKRAAAAHVIFNLLGTMIFLLLLPVVLPIVVATSADVVRQIANAHTIFNLGNTLLQLPFVGVIVWLVVRIVPGKDVEEETVKPNHLDERFVDTPSLAIAQAKKDMTIMAQMARGLVHDAVDLITTGNGRDMEKLLQEERTINLFNREIAAYLSKVGQTPVASAHLPLLRQYHSVLSDIERIGDHGENIVELAQYCRENDIQFSETALEEIQSLASQALGTFDHAMKAWGHDDRASARQAMDSEEQVNILEERYRTSHIDRLNNNECHPTAGVIFLDLASNLERVSDHAANIAEYA